jgi:lysophospholipase L1-like esterase
MPQAGSFVALGDSFTEGIGDPYPDGSGCRGWADRFAERLAQDNPGLRYANLAIRGKMLGQVLADQVPAAISMSPDLVSIAAGGNDLLRPRSDPDALARQFDNAVGRLRAAGSQVMVITGFDTRTFPLLRLIRGKAAAYNMHLRVIAGRHDCLLMDLWAMRVLADPREWAPDRLHMAPDAHRRVALRACEVVGLAVDEDWRDPLPPARQPAGPAGRAGWLAARREDALWAREHAAPWVSRRLRGVSTGDGMLAKRPELLQLSAPARQQGPPGP